MEAFAYQQHQPFLLDSACQYPNTSIEMLLHPQQVGEMTNAASCFPYYCYSSEAIQEVSRTDTRVHENSSSLETGPKVFSGDQSLMNYSSDGLDPYDEKVPDQQSSTEKKRKNRGACLISGQSEDSEESKSRKQKRPTGGLKGKEGTATAADMKATKSGDEPPTGYIHVRARRGQATDSHSLAERVRREKISDRMKMLQGLVPGCDKVVGKALMLDEIINYVQSLQNQVEFLSMKLASVNPILYDFSVDFDDCMNRLDQNMVSLPQPVPSINQTSTPIQPKALENTTATYQLMDRSSPLSVHGQGPTAFPQDCGDLLMQVDDQRQGLLSQPEFNNICSF